MKRIFSPVFLWISVILPQLAAIGYVAAVSDSNKNNAFQALFIAALAADLATAAYAWVRRNQEMIETRIFIAVSAVYMLFAMITSIIEPQAFERFAGLNPKLVFAGVCLLSVLYGIAGIAYNTTNKGFTYHTLRYVGGIIIMPIVFLMGMGIVNHTNANAFALVLIIGIAYAIAFFLLKLFFAWRLTKTPLDFESTPSKKYLITIFIVAFCMPLAGLTLNLTFGGPDASGGIFGDFSNPLFFIIAAVNGSLLLVPPVKDTSLRLGLFYLKSVGYAYILYFFVVFLPVMPLGFFGIIIYGLGLLVLSPAAITCLQGYHLLKEAAILAKTRSFAILLSLFIAGLLTLPLAMTAVCWGDKVNFNAAVQYLGKTEITNSAPVDTVRLHRTLKHIRGSLDPAQREFGFTSDTVPIISGLYSRAILDGKTSTESNVKALENLFFDTGHDLSPLASVESIVSNSYVQLSDITADTKFDTKNGVYRSWVHLKLQNPNDAGNGEYRSSFKLPEGAYISDYYLDVAGTRKPGILADRRAAIMIYRRIVNLSRDPGLLHYTGPNTLELRVFPFNPRETRTTGFEILHSQKFDLTLNGKTVTLDGDQLQKQVDVNGAVLLPAEQKKGLKPVVRKAAYYFVVDSSKNSNRQWLNKQVRDYVKTHGIDRAKVVFASYRLEASELANMDQVKIKSEGGYNLNLAVRDILRDEAEGSFPIIIAVTDNLPGAVLPTDLQALADKYPESLSYYHLNPNLTLTAYAFEDNKAGDTIEQPIISPVLDYNGHLVVNDCSSELVLTNPKESRFEPTGNIYKDAVLLDAVQQKAMRAGTADSAQMVRDSFRAGILTHQTALIVVETTEQEKQLMDIQERFLNSTDEEAMEMLSEPSPLWCFVLMTVLAVLIVLRKRTRMVL